MPAISIPSELKPREARFGCGPSLIRPAQLDALQAAGSTLLGTSHRQPAVKDLVGKIRSGLLELFQAPTGYEVALGNGGSTAFWDVAAFSLVENQAAALVHGEFGAKFARALSAPWLKPARIFEGAPGGASEFTVDSEVDTYAYPQNETSTGVVVPVVRPAGAAKDAITLTDATSAAGGMWFDAQQTDCYYFAPQKNFGSDGGLWLALLSPAAIERSAKLASARYIPEFLSLQVAIENSRQNQTLNTPAIATLVLLENQLDWMLRSGGLSWAAKRTQLTSQLIYSWAESHPLATPFVSDPAKRSPVVVTIDFEDSVSAPDLALHLRSNGILDVEPYRKLGRNQLRVATFTATETSDVEALLACIDYVLERM